MTRFHRHAARGLGLVLHRLATIALGTAVILSVLLAAAAWRLSRGPLDVAWFTGRLEAAANANGGPTKLSIASTALAWEGFRLGVDSPIDLRLTDIRLTDASGLRHVEIPRAEVSLSLAALLLGRLQPSALELDGPELTIRRAKDGTLSVDLGSMTRPTEPEPPDNQIGSPLPALLALLAKPPTTDETAAPGWFSQLRRVRIRDAVVTVVDRKLGVTWRAPRAEVNLTRRAAGGVNGAADLSLALGDQRARLTGTATLSRDAAETHVTARLSAIAPAALARAAPALDFLSALDAPVSAEATADFGPALDLRQAQVALQAGAGTLRIGTGSLPIAGASLVASGTPDAIRLDAAQLRLRAHEGEAPSTLSVTGTVQRGNGRVEADLSLGLDQVAFADLPVLWPRGLGSNARSWILENITAGVAHDGHAEIGLAANADLSAVTLTRASGSLEGSGLTVSWLRPVPPVEQGSAVLRIVDPDTLQIGLMSGRQALRSGNGLALTGGSMRITGLAQHDQVATIQADVAGSLPDAIALLREPRLQLLDRHPITLGNPAGDVVATIAATVPLEKHVTMDDIAIRVGAHVTDAFLGGVAAGRDLSGGTLDLVATNTGLTVKGQALLAGIPASLDAAMDFRAGPPAQVLQRVTAIGQADAKQLAAAGLDATGLLAGPIGLRAVLTEQRDGSGGVSVDADLTDATLTVAPLDWRKPPGAAAHATASLRLQHDRLGAIDRIEAEADGLTLRASAACADGRISLVRLDRLTLGRSEMQGTVRFPASPRAAPIAVRLSGPLLDLSARLSRPKAARHGPRPAASPPVASPPVASPPGPPWTLDARFDRVLMAGGYLFAPVSVQAENDGTVFRRLRVEGATRDNGAFALRIVPDAGGRRLTATAAKAGDLLRALDVTGTMQDGSLRISGTYDDSRPGHPLHGTVELTDFRVSRAAALGKLLQAMTLYGLVDVLRGPGLAFARLVAPFTLSDDVLELADARAFSPSLGLTAKGRIDIDAGTADLQGTIVPAYFFNALLGNVPLVGRLFSPERGGGVFAASYTLRGDLDDPAVTVNPLAALTPGFLRGLFGLF
ncbi:MAG TPA: AsmA-like C-terminal region-containing protein [Acetobacteraceae bacterium]|nr:AsmA-like C-terminal region-containing protein [Acetobacteraceae bacterium]